MAASASSVALSFFSRIVIDWISRFPQESHKTGPARTKRSLIGFGDRAETGMR
jgi:hypothetical protein